MQIIDPLTDARWAAFVERHPDACAFHSRSWLQALSGTYGYQPLAVTSSAPTAELTDALPLCRISSWVTGRRIVSLPFTDHCQPLAAMETATAEMFEFISGMAQQEGYRFCELRPVRPLTAGIGDQNRSATYWFHWLTLEPPLERLFQNLDKDSIQRKIRRADREGLGYEQGNTSELIAKFYRLLLRTRRRHQLPPQPLQWFENLASSMGDSIQFRIAKKGEVAIAAIVTLTHRNSLIYKYGCSDERYHAAGSMPFLFWRTIEEAKSAGIPLMDFGRSDLDNPGLIRFKDQWGTHKGELSYYRFPASAPAHKPIGFAEKAAKETFARLPDRLLAMAGKMIYRHIG